MTPAPGAPLRVGVVGAGPWARMVHAPMLVAHPAVDLVGVWARRPAAAAEVAAANATTACETFDELLGRCQAVVFAVPPDVQAELGVVAARAGKALLLEKPLALDLAAAERLAGAVGDAGVGSQLVLTWRYTPTVRSFLADVADAEPIGGRGRFLAGGALGGPFATPWRLEHGPLFDLGPHVIDVLDAALGPVVGVRAAGDLRRWVGLLLEHDGGRTSEVSLTLGSALEPNHAGVEVYSAAGAIGFDGAATGADAAVFATVVDELVATARGVPHALGAQRGLHLQRVLHAAVADLGRSATPI